MKSRRINEAGFTMAEVMVALIVFIVAIVGLVAMESRGIEAQRASMETREGERLAQEVMAELLSTSFDELVEFDFAGGTFPSLPYDDAELQTFQVRDYGAVPNATGERAPGTRADFFWVGRKVDRWPFAACSCAPFGSTTHGFRPWEEAGHEQLVFTPGAPG
jgi:type II secretory pathway pseudopilin PulG